MLFRLCRSVRFDGDGTPVGRVARGSKDLFSVRVREQIAGNEVLVAIIKPLLVVWHAIREQVEQVALLDRQTLARARTDAAARHLMTIPGVGVVVALAYTRCHR